GWDGRGFIDDIWVLALTGTHAWTQLSIPGARPLARAGHSCLYDPNGDRMIVFGGGVPGAYDANDTWALRLSGPPVWTKLKATGTPPPGRSSHSAVYDPHRRRMIVVGGWGNWEEGMDTWALSLEGAPAWTPLLDGGRPSWGRSDHTAVYDSGRNRMVVFGGWSYESDYVLGDTWALSLTGDRA